MGSALRWLIAPVLRAWVASKSGEVDRLPRPSDAPESHSEGINSDRVLIFGGGPAVGWGVLSHEVALPGALSRALSRRTGRGADVYAIAIPRLKLYSALAELAKITLYRYDAVFLLVGVNDAGALTSLTSWERDLTRMLRTVSLRTSMSARIFVGGVHSIRSIPIYDSPLGSIANAHARKMNAITEQVCDQIPRVTFVPLSAPDPSNPVRFRDAMSYLHWANELADSAAFQLDDGRQVADFNRALRNDDDPDSVRERARALADLKILRDERNWRFERFIRLACETFGVRGATVSVINSDHLIHKAQIGNVPQHITLGASFTAEVIRESEGLIVADAAVDARFRNLPHVFGPPRIRFYAGFPLEAPNGTRIGTLNIFDPAPRLSEEPWRLLRLRQFGLMVQSEMRNSRDPQ